MKKIYTIILLAIVSTIANAQYTKLLDFNISAATTGNSPQGSLITDGTFLYGMTNTGGTNSKGNIFKIKFDGTGYLSMNSFNTSGTLGYNPHGSLYYDGTYLYGTTALGGGSSGEYGNIFKIKPDGTSFDTLMGFSGTTGNYLGSSPYCTLVSDGTFLYGMTNYGGTGICSSIGCGVIFKIKPDGTSYDTLHCFGRGADGNWPYGSLYYDGSTFLYGMTYGGGTGSAGNIFKIKTDGTGYTDLYDFPCGAGSCSPEGSLISDGTYLYGMTAFGGAAGNWGTVFKVKLDGTGYSILHNFNGTAYTDGYYPYGDLVYDGTTLYGMAAYGGDGIHYGEIFEIQPDGTGYDTLHIFGRNSTDGEDPKGSLLLNGGCLYGMTSGGGLSNSGTIFKYCLGANGIDESNENNDFTIYPNPSSGKFQVSSIRYQELSIEIYNVMGEKIYQSTNQQLNNSIIDLNNQPNGIYFLQLKTEQGTANKKIIIQR